MEKNAVISVKSFTDLDKKDIIEVVTPGKFLIDEDGFKAIYEETEISGMDGTTTTLKILGDSFVLERQGNVSTKMDFKKGETSVSLYNTPYGMMDLQIHTDYLEIDMDENGGDLIAKYSMAISGQEPIMTKISVNVKIQ
ncbi:DUF1934 domain-containing protein [Clostridium chauvoei]|uniref:Calycin-like domain-containing protein n=2 Tax=Clostridium chauvoei TaxID=46867 RepID=S6ETU8_9CLOT|nr:DUF1934 domain-containing protein [Clostridium chauvoei]ATD55946.1 hypothetical protein BTM20_12200 [Clostridium chauvoei]ATD56383.1 hypothetical protein BTM21_00815 [Clostridium chauvoei]MBX7281691.1 DUF1934 domain-containing protein [Clostridium chauvoei]MBX7284211.1 DUF1934 domain-containing protein [Clostridium chauvoei]MBX7286739.1 DUF1934 domain-containing protein [Clostridium chauvoei]